MFFLPSKIIGFFLAPFHFFMIVAVIGAMLLFTRWKTWGRALSTVSAFALLLMAFGPLGGLLASPLEARFPPPPHDMPAPDGIIVLGGAIDERLSASRDRPTVVDAAERLIAPISLKRKYPSARLVFTGGSAALQASPYSEADAVQRFWRDLGLDQGDVLYERRSRNTYENAIFTRDLLLPKPGERWLLVTSAIHMPRAIGAFRQAGFDVIAYPVDYRTSGDSRLEFPRFATKALGLVEFAAHEWAGLVAQRLFGKSDALFPAP
ncbi:YdcF family protein [Methylocystis sp. H62]|uniref:YdcF family protein n=1 Tax=Methylocystis sp. H62 TaxID=2785789 RepID=UPI0018C1D8BA|nr:YdcF family protein [Methylocystis sp. H62]MBG0795401.1 YdcF family protein [Methylocystis sp. H62]